MKKRTYFAALLPFLILAGMFEILPVFTIIVKSFMPESGETGFTIQNYINIFSKPLYLTAIKNSLLISVISAVIGCWLPLSEAGPHARREAAQSVFL